MGGPPNKGTKRDMRLASNKKTTKANTSARKSATSTNRVVKGGK